MSCRATVVNLYCQLALSASLKSHLALALNHTVQRVVIPSSSALPTTYPGIQIQIQSPRFRLTYFYVSSLTSAFWAY